MLIEIKMRACEVLIQMQSQDEESMRRVLIRCVLARRKCVARETEI